MPGDRTDQSFNRTDIALQAASAGQGIAMARASLVDIDMLEMNLFRQVGRAVKMKYSYYFVCQPGRANNPAIVNLKEWLVEELALSLDKVKQSLII